MYAQPVLEVNITVRNNFVSPLVHLSNSSLVTYLALTQTELTLETTCWILLRCKSTLRNSLLETVPNEWSPRPAHTKPYIQSQECTKSIRVAAHTGDPGTHRAMCQKFKATLCYRASYRPAWEYATVSKLKNKQTHKQTEKKPSKVKYIWWKPNRGYE